jgi:hypothetical protein
MAKLKDSILMGAVPQENLNSQVWEAWAICSFSGGLLLMAFIQVPKMRISGRTAVCH